ncbi:MAG: porin family protein [Lentisphaerae bacterium]|nr:porin family protein [Lentisphaerota bacterium]
MTRWLTGLCVLGAVWATSMPAMAASSEHWIGGGAHYWTTVDDVDVGNIDEEGIGWFASYQWRPGSLLSFEADVEVLPDHFAGAEDTVYAPQAYLLLGSTLYAGVGIGYYYANDEFSKDPFYVLKAGLNLEILPRIALDLSGDYRFTEWDDNVTKDIDSDTVTLSAAVRLGL